MSQSYHLMLHRLQTSILAGDDGDATTHYRAKESFPPEKQLAIYIHGYRERLRKVLGNIFPATHYYLGDDSFDPLARAFIEATPSIHSNLDRYPLTFDRYLADQTIPSEAKDLARLESAIHNVYQMPDSAALPANWLAAQSEEALLNYRFTARRALLTLPLHYDADSYLKAFRSGKPLGAFVKKENFLVVVRHENEVRRHMIDGDGYILLKQLLAGVPLGEALEAVAEEIDLETAIGQLQSWFTLWLAQGFFAID